MTFDEFFRAAYPRLMARAVMLCGHRADAEDVAAQAFAEVARNWARVAGYDAPEAYLHVTMTRKAFRLFRQRRRQEEVAALELPRAPHETPEDAVAAKEVLAAIAGLPPTQRAVLVHCCLDGMRQQEVADVLGIQRGTVAAHLHKARAALSVKLGMPVPTLRDPSWASTPAHVEVKALRHVEQWLADAFAADEVTRDRVQAAVDLVPPPQRWWRRG